MYLKRLELSGFKSFAKKTTLDFPRGITVVAGPNGSGKSNIVDAIRWALAEQSFKNLRGKKGEDLIFYGSGVRNSLSRASVAMTFEAESHTAHLDWAEAVVAREVYKNGDNNYLINDRKVRLADMGEFLAKSRIGDSSFRVLSQGMSDKLLNLSPQEFRGFIEEAAGVKEYQDKKYQTELKVKNTRENLEKVAAILAEISPRLKVLKREKEKLAKKEAYAAELKTVSLALFGRRYRKLSEIEKKNSERKNILNREFKPVASQMTQLKENLFSFEKKTAVHLELGELAQKIKNMEAEDNRLTKEIIRCEGEISLALERHRQKLPVTAEHLKNKISGLLKHFSGDVKGWEADRLRKLIAEVEHGLQDLLLKMEKGLHQADLSNNLHVLKDTLARLTTEKEKIGGEFNRLVLDKNQKEESLTSERQTVLTREKEYRQKESELSVLENSLRQLELEEEKLKLHKEKLHQDMAGVGTVTLAEILYAENSSEPKPALALSLNMDEAALEDKLWKLKRKVEEIGLIDDAVLTEYESVNERYNFLTKESEDLESILGALMGLMGNLDKEVGEKYKNTLAEMSHVFGGYFRLIFGGGQATLAEAKMKSKISNLKSQKLETADGVSDYEEDESGVEIKLDLPNKKVKSLNTLSGGERTLTSIALLLALASIRKPPVMVLDEIDAALDEPNTAKFIHLVKELSKQTQFIIITHNRETMRGADALYGVSMKDGISHLLSLKLHSA